MTIPDASALSCYREIGLLNAAHGTALVQHITSGRIYVKKTLPARTADVSVYTFLRDHYVKGIPEIAEVVETAGNAADLEAAVNAAHTEAAGHIGAMATAGNTEAAGSDGHLIVIEEYISGRSIRSILDSGSTFPKEEAVRITEQVCRTIQALHSAEPPILGTALSPSGILLTAESSICIVDLQNARQARPGQTDDEAGSGIRDDIASIGLLFCELLTGSRPGTDRPAGSGHSSDLSLGLSPDKLPGGRPGKIIRKCIGAGRGGRYRRVREVLQALAACHRQPVIDRSMTSGCYLCDDLPEEAEPDRNRKLSVSALPPEGSIPGSGREGEASPHVSTDRPDFVSTRTKRRPASPGRFLLPGYRSGNPLHYLSATCAYAALLYLSFIFTLEGFTPGYQLWVERLVFFLSGLIILLFTGNWMDIWRILRISRIRSPLVRLLAVLVIDALLFLAGVLAVIFTAVGLGVYHFTGA